MKNFVTKFGRSKIASSSILAAALALSGCGNNGSVGPAGPQGPQGPGGSNGGSGSVSNEYNTPFNYQTVPGTDNASCNWSISIYALQSDGTFDANNALTTAKAMKSKSSCTATPRYNAHQGDWLVAQVTDGATQFSLIYQAGGSIAGSAQSAPATITPYTDVIASFIEAGMSVHLLPLSYLNEKQIVDLQNAVAAGSACSAKVKAKPQEPCNILDLDTDLAANAAMWVNDFANGGFAVPSVLSAGDGFAQGGTSQVAPFALGASSTVNTAGAITVDSGTCLPTNLNGQDHVVTLSNYTASTCAADKLMSATNHQAAEGTGTMTGGLNVTTEVIALGNGYDDEDDNFEQRGTSALVCVSLSAPAAITSKTADVVLTIGNVGGYDTATPPASAVPAATVTNMGPTVDASTRSIAFTDSATPFAHVLAVGWDANSRGLGNVQVVSIAADPMATPPVAAANNVLFTVAGKTWMAGEQGTFCVAMVELTSAADVTNFNNDILNAAGASFSMPENLSSMTNSLIGTFNTAAVAIAGLETRALYASSEFLGLLDSTNFGGNSLINSDISVATAPQRMIYNTNMCTGFLGLAPGQEGQIFAGSTVTGNPMIDVSASSFLNVFVGNTCFGVAAAAGDVFTVVAPGVTGFANRTITVSSSLTDIDDAAAALGSSN